MDLIKLCIMNIFRLLNHTELDPNSPYLEAFPLLRHPISLNVFFSQTIQHQVPLVLKQIIQAKELLTLKAEEVLVFLKYTIKERTIFSRGGSIKFKEKKIFYFCLGMGFV